MKVLVHMKWLFQGFLKKKKNSSYGKSRKVSFESSAKT